MADVADVLTRIFGSSAAPHVIGTRHGEKLFETLASREELARAEDLGEYFRVPVDDRDLNYSIYFTEGQPEQADLDDYNSHNTDRLTPEELERLIVTLPDIQVELESA